MGRGNPAPYRARRSARLTGCGLGRVSVLISKADLSQQRIERAQTRRAGKSTDGMADLKDQNIGQDCTQDLPEALLEEIFKELEPSDIVTCTAVCKRWKALSDSPAIWKPICEELWLGKQYTPPLEKGLSYMEMYYASLAESERTDMKSEELCGWIWTFRFKLQAGHYWTSSDPYWSKQGPLMQRQFQPDGSLAGCPKHPPLWNPAWESRWRFTKSKLGKRGLYVKVNHWPALSISRTPDWGWRMENCWVEYLSVPCEQGRLQPQLASAGKSAAA